MCQLAVACSAGDAQYDCLRLVGSVQGAREIVFIYSGLCRAT
jgi:hypothetical protein